MDLAKLPGASFTLTQKAAIFLIRTRQQNVSRNERTPHLSTKSCHLSLGCKSFASIHIMQDISTLNSKLQSISASLEEIQSKVLVQDENIRRSTKDRIVAREAKEELEKQLAHQAQLLEQEEAAFQKVAEVSCRLEIERDSGDYLLGLIPPLIRKTCNDYERFSTKTGNQIRAKCKILQENNFWVTKQTQADSEREEFQQTLGETLTNRIAFSSSEEERLRTQLEIEETQLAFLEKRISDLECEAARANDSGPSGTHLVTPSPPPPTTSPSPSTSRAFQSPRQTDRAVMAHGATTHTRAFVPPVAVATPRHASQTPYASHAASSPRGLSNPFEDWTDRGTSGTSGSAVHSPQRPSVRAAPAQSTPQQRESPPIHHQQARADRSFVGESGSDEEEGNRDQTHEDARAVVAVHAKRAISSPAAPLQQGRREYDRDTGASVDADTAMSDADYELDCTVAAQRLQHRAPPLLPPRVSPGQRVELTVSTTTITEYTMQSGPEEFPHLAPSFSHLPHHPHNTPYTPYTAHHSPVPAPHQSRDSPLTRNEFTALGGSRQDEVPWFREYKRKRTVGPTPPLYGGYGTGGYGAGSGGYGGPGGPYMPQQQYPFQQSQVPPQVDQCGAPPQYSSPPLWPSPSPYASPPRPSREESVGAARDAFADQRATGRFAPVGMHPGPGPRGGPGATGTDLRGRSRSESPVVPLSPQRLEVIDLYEASDDDSSDPAPAPAPAVPSVVPATRRSAAQDAQQGAVGSQYQSHAGPEASTVWGRDREPRTMPAHSGVPQQNAPQHTALKDRFRTGLDMLQRPTRDSEQ